MKHFVLNINYEELKLRSEIPVLVKLRLNNLFRKNTWSGGRTLVIDTCIIGDFLATLPALRQFIGNSQQGVDLLVSPPLRSLARSIKGVNRVFTARSVYSREIEAVEGGERLPAEYDNVLVLRVSEDAYKLLSGIKYSNIRTYEVPYFKYVGHLIKNILLKKEVKQWRNVNFEMIGMKEPEEKPRFEEIFEFTEKDYSGVMAMPELAGSGKKVLIHSGSGWKIKLWENEKWIELLKKIHGLGDFSFIFIGGGDFEARAFELIQKGLDFKIHSLINKTDLRELLLLMRKCDYFIGIDSGPRNMAHLADLRSISLLGPAPKNFMPYNPEDIVIDKFKCRCKSLFYLHKVSGMQKISADEVFESFKKLLKVPAAAGN